MLNYLDLHGDLAFVKNRHLLLGIARVRIRIYPHLLRDLLAVDAGISRIPATRLQGDLRVVTRADGFVVARVNFSASQVIAATLLHQRVALS